MIILVKFVDMVTNDTKVFAVLSYENRNAGKIVFKGSHEQCKNFLKDKDIVDFSIVSLPRKKYYGDDDSRVD